MRLAIDMHICETRSLAEKLGTQLLAKHWTITTAESCTGGGISSAITDVAGSSSWFHQAFITYSNDAKRQMLGVPADLLERHGAVSEEVVRAMLEGALEYSSANIGLAVSGIAGPGGAVEGKPVGTVWIAWGGGERIESRCFQFDGDRAEVRLQVVCKALELASAWLP